MVHTLLCDVLGGDIVVLIYMYNNTYIDIHVYTYIYVYRYILVYIYIDIHGSHVVVRRARRRHRRPSGQHGRRRPFRSARPRVRVAAGVLHGMNGSQIRG